MNTDTGYINVSPTLPLDKKEILIPDKDLEQVINMNRKQRREWAREEKKRSKRNL